MHKRAARDLADLAAHGVELRGEDGGAVADVAAFHARVLGPPGTPYAGAAFWVRFTLCSHFPFKSPSVGFVDRVVHPNVEFASGSVCLDALNSRWSPNFTLRHVVEDLLPYLLAYPNVDDPLNREAAGELVRDPAAYAAAVRAAIPPRCVVAPPAAGATA